MLALRRLEGLALSKGEELAPGFRLVSSPAAFRTDLKSP